MKLIAFLTFSLYIGAIHAQKPCEKASIYFDVNQSKITPQSLTVLKKFTEKLNGTDYLIELYGYADSTASAEYNLALSQKRIDSVKFLLNKLKTINFNYFETNLGEEQSTEVKDLSLSRRVDIFVIPIENNKIVIRDGDAEVAVALDYFSPCGACQTKPKIDAYYTDEEARSANIEFETTEGIPLITAGTFDFNFTPCETKQVKKTKEPLCFVISSSSKEKIDREMSLWEPEVINGITYWKPSTVTPKFDTLNNTYQFCVLTPMFNLDKPEIGKIYIFPSELTEKRSEFSNLDLNTHLKTAEDTVIPGSFTFLSSFGAIGDTFFHFKRKPEEIPITKKNMLEIAGRMEIVSVEFTIDLSMYQRLIFSESDTTLMVKLKNKPIQVGYYLKDVHQFIPFEWNKKNKRFYGQKPTGEFQLAYLKKRDRLYVLPEQKMKLKYKRFRKYYKLKLRIKNTKLYKRDKEYTQKKAEWDEFFD